MIWYATTPTLSFDAVHDSSTVVSVTLPTLTFVGDVGACVSAACPLTAPNAIGLMATTISPATVPPIASGSLERNATNSSHTWVEGVRRRVQGRGEVLRSDWLSGAHARRLGALARSPSRDSLRNTSPTPVRR